MEIALTLEDLAKQVAALHKTAVIVKLVDDPAEFSKQLAKVQERMQEYKNKCDDNSRIAWVEAQALLGDMIAEVVVPEGSTTEHRQKGDWEQDQLDQKDPRSL